MRMISGGIGRRFRTGTVYFFGNLPAIEAAGATGLAARISARAAPLLHGDAADHAVPIVVGAAQIIGAGLAGGEKNILGLAGLHHDLATLAIERIGIVDFGSGEKYRRGEFV